jgi:acyl-CoA thioesterase FadM
MHRFEREALKVRPANPFLEHRTIRFQDVDAAGIIFYPRLIEYCHDLLVAFFAANGQPLDRALADKTWGSPIRHAEADYFRPLRFADRVEVALVKAHVEPSEVALGFRIAHASSPDEVCTVVQSIHTFVNLETFRRSDVPPALHAAFSQIGE